MPTGSTLYLSCFSQYYYDYYKLFLWNLMFIYNQHRMKRFLVYSQDKLVAPSLKMSSLAFVDLGLMVHLDGNGWLHYLRRCTLQMDYEK
jgi:hypothetical protein